MLIRTDIHPYHITSRSHDREFFPLPLKDVWEIMLSGLKEVSEDQKLAVHAFVLMGNHFHLLCHTPQSNIDQVMRVFLKKTSHEILRRASRESPLWGGRYKWSVIDNWTYYYQVYRYIYQNPVRVKLVERVEDYKFSTLYQDPKFPIHSRMTMKFGGREGELHWLNQKLDQADQEEIKKGLRKYQFSISKRKEKNIHRLSN